MATKGGEHRINGGPWSLSLKEEPLEGVLWGLGVADAIRAG